MKLYSVIKEGRVNIGELTPKSIKIENYQTEDLDDTLADSIRRALPNRFATKAFPDEAKQAAGNRRRRARSTGDSSQGAQEQSDSSTSASAQSSQMQQSNESKDQGTNSAGNNSG